MSDSTSEPILRWLGTWSPYGKPSSREPSPSSSSTNLSPSLVSLNEALNEQLALPRPPKAAQLSHFSLSKQPPFLDNLTRSTLPTASLAAPAVVSNNSSPTSPTFRARSSARSNDPLDSTEINLNHSPPSRTSLDSLRTLSRRDSAFRQSHSRSASTASALDSESNTNWWWFQSGNKDNVDTLLEEEDRADTVGEEQERIRKKYHSPRNPVVFCHGLLGFDSVTIGPSIAPMQVMHWRGIKEVLEANGTEVLITRVPATSSPVERARVLEERISEVYPGRSVHLIGHSMGGIDCRYLTTHLTKRKFSVLSITTIATPHRGSAFADHFLTTLGKGRMDSFLSLLDLLPNGGGNGKAFECLTIESMRKFNEQVPDVPGVKYFSWGSVYEPGRIGKGRPNDGLVSVESAKWGKYLGTLQDVNHLDLVGWINPARFKWAEMTGKQINFRPATFYLGVADMIARDVDGVVDEPEDRGGSKAGEGANVQPDSSGNSQAKVDTQTDRRAQNTNSSSGPTEMRFAADEGEVIDNVVLVGEGANIQPDTSGDSQAKVDIQTDRTSSDYKLFVWAHGNETPPPPTPPPKDRSSSKRQSVVAVDASKHIPVRDSTIQSNPTEKKADGIFPNWASLVSDSLASLTSRSSSPSSRSSLSSSS
ncbi:alpha/beta-hydrolase [Gymnopus androsaceus JB14]|uniref:GPI inositol-deacylase n=1 Tax=Gymnopus androsaceus JB14 TaxID=1447944 RepID=A0A6A4ICF3_9AGAR|nr:alpha/beta-hydrolase [Gymnopus androsaceus JB14]